MRVAHVLIATGLLAASAPAGADVITSTTSGGFWSIGSTWVGGVPPVATDDVVIAGPVAVGVATAPCHALTVLPAGELTNANNSLRKVSASGDVLNQGTLRDNIYAFAIEVGGSIANEGDWLLDETRITGAGDRSIAMAPGSVFSSNLHPAPGAAGKLFATTPLAITGSVEMGAVPLVLGANCPLTVEFGFIAGEIRAAGNAVIGQGSAAILAACTLDQAVLDGTLNVYGSDVAFTGGLTVQGVLEPYASGGFNIAHVTGTLLNLGEIRNASGQGLSILLTGDLVNNGILANSQVDFVYGGQYHLSAGGSPPLAVNLFLAEFGSETLYVDTPVTTSDQIGVGVSTVVLGAGCDLTLTGFGTIWTSFDGQLLANGNTLRQVGANCSLLRVGVDNARLAGYFTIGANTPFTGGVTVVDTLVNRAFNSVSAEMVDRLDNEGLITQNGGAFTVILRADAENRGVWNNARVEVDGDADQFIGAGGGIDVPQFALYANLPAGPYQWTRDGATIPGATSSTLTLAGVGAADYGTYRCEGAGGALSRRIVIAEFADPTAAGDAAPALRLAGNHPNPFNPSTEFRFSLAAAGPVRLTIYDAAGREVARPVDRVLGAGEQQVRWAPRDLGSGVYLYRLEAGGELRTGKATLLK
ncbi:MAG: T9SS type A sorting domain-containing protein [Candidatus Latescibacteria bacterium]|nr:T9SS type A sorting domain-containing protein [Candidatus Latescibacterota bacterium]